MMWKAQNLDITKIVFRTPVSRKLIIMIRHARPRVMDDVDYSLPYLKVEVPKVGTNLPIHY